MTKSFLSVVLLIIVIIFGWACTASALTWYHWDVNDHWYAVDETAKTWPDAKSFAQNQGGYLATITSAEEQTFLTNTIGPLINYSWKWIGLYDSFYELGGTGAKTWVWVTTNEPVSFTNWDGGEPNNNGGNEHYGEMYANGKWNDLMGESSPVYGIIERNSSPVPLPSAVLLLGSGLLGLAGWRRFRKD